MDDNLARLTQTTEELKSNKGNSTPFLYQPPFSSLLPLSSKKFVTLPPNWLNFWKVLLPINKRSFHLCQRLYNWNNYSKIKLIFQAYQCFFTVNILFDEVDRGLEHEKKFLLDIIYIMFSLKTVRDDLSQ